jgi:hypothetical protein
LPSVRILRSQKDPVVWQLESHVAKLAVDGFWISVDVAEPNKGLSIARSAESLVDAEQILCVELGNCDPLDAARVDAFVRGRDLVVTYAERPPRHVRAQVYWRNISPEEFAPGLQQNIAVAFDLILSVNTSLLDEDPQSMVRSSVASASEIVNVRTAPGCFIIRTGGEGLQSYVEMVHPADYQESRAFIDDSAPPRAQLAHKLFAQRLEKGVILRARVRAALVDGPSDEVVALAAFQHFAAAEPPLTV